MLFLKTLTKQMKTLLLVVLSFGLFISCPSPRNETQQVNPRLARTNPIGGGGGSLVGTGPRGNGQTLASGSLYSNAIYDQNFNISVRNFVSSFMDPNYLGHVDPTNGITFYGYIIFDSSGNVVPGNNTGIHITIRDSYTGNGSSGGATGGGPLLPIEIEVLVKNGWLRNGQADLVFEDDFGSIHLVGNYDNSQFQGYLSYINKRIYPGAQDSPYSGDGWQFRITTCGFFVCQ